MDKAARQRSWVIRRIRQRPGERLRLKRKAKAARLAAAVKLELISGAGTTAESRQ